MSLVAAGRSWVGLYPTSRSVQDLAEPFRGKVQLFLEELDRQGCDVRITATRRPAERAWLMRMAWDIVHRGLDPENVPARNPPIPIIWTVQGAREMVAAYGLAYRPSLTSRHIDGRAIDMVITGWKGTQNELWQLGARLGVVKLPQDPPHWSDDGR